MITGVQDVYYNVQDMRRAVDFYHNVLGLTVTDEDPHFTGLNAGGVRIGLHWTGGTAVPSTPRNAHGPHNGGTITFRVDNIMTAKDMLTAGGANILGFSDNPWGKIIIFEDPDGNVLKLMQPPG